MAAKDSFEIIDGESPKEFTEVTCELEEFEVHFEDHGEPPTSVGELSTRNETETEQPGQQGLSFGTFWQEHHDQMEKKAEDCEEENSELFQLGQDGFNTRKQERRSKVRQLSEKINRESQKPEVSRSSQSQEEASYNERMVRIIESSRAEPYLVEFQSSPKGGSGSLSFSILPMPQQGSEKDVSGIEQSALGAGPSLVTKPLPNSAEGGEIAPHVHSTTQMPGNMEHTGARPKEIKVPQRRASAVKTAPKGNRQPGNITEALRNSTESIEIAPDVHSTTQMPVLGESQAHVAGLPHHTPGIYPQFLARHSTDQSLLNNNQTRTRNPQISGTRSQMRPDVDSQNLFLVGHTHPNHRNMPTEQDDTAGWPSTMERRRITERWCSCFRLVENDDDLRPICELCLRHRYRGPRTCSQMNQHVCCYCFQDGVGDFLSLPCHHKFHRECIIAAIQLNMLNCPICGQAFLHLP